MVVQALDEVERDIARTREDIERQREAIETLRKRAATAKAIREAELMMLGLVRHLAMLRERRNAILHAERRPPAKSIPEPVPEVSRRKKDA